MAGFINIGFGNIVNRDKIVAVVSPDAAPVKRMVQQGKEEKIVIDATQGRRTKAVLVTQEGFLVLSALQPDTIGKRLHAEKIYRRKRVIWMSKKRKSGNYFRFLRCRKGNSSQRTDEEL